MEGTKKQKLWTGYFILICCMALFTSLVMRLLDNTLAIYANDIWGSKSAGGLLTTTFTFGSIISSAFSGSVIDRTGRKKALIFGAVVFIVVTFGLLIFTQKWIVMIIRVLQGLGKAVVMVASASMAADIIPKERMGEGMGYYGMGGTLASAFGPALGIWMISGGNYNLMFLSCAGLYIAVIIMVSFVNYEKEQRLRPHVEEETKSEPEPETKKAAMTPRHGVWRFFEKSALPIAVVTFFGSAGTTCVLVFLTLYATDGLGIENPGLFFTFSAVTMLLTRLLIGKVIDRHGIAVVVVPAFLLGIGLYLLLAFVAGSAGAAYVLFLICGAFYGVVTAIFYPAVQSVAVVDAPPERKGVANSTMFFGQDLGILVSSAVLGWVVEAWGYEAMFLCGIALFIISILLTLALMRNQTRAKRRARYGVD